MGLARMKIGGILIVAGIMLLLTACGCPPQTAADSQPTATVGATASPVPTATEPVPTNTPELPTHTPTFAVSVVNSATPTPSSTSTLTLTSTLVHPTSTPTPYPQVTGARVIYHDGIYRDGAGRYKPGVLPWLDLLVRLDETWYGPEREPSDGIDAQPLPEGYRWEVDSGFGTLPNGEAWWTGPEVEGTARLIDADDEVILELMLRVVFYDPSEKEPAEPTPCSPTPVPT